MLTKKLCCVTAVFALALAAAALAQVPTVINYQGQLLDASGAAANGDFTMDFSIFDVAIGGAALYSETQNVTVSNGIFNVLIGSATPIPQDLFDATPHTRYLEITVDGTALTPRRLFGSVAYAFNSGSDNITSVNAGVGLATNANTGEVTLRIADDGVTSNKILDSTISSADLAANSVHNNQIATGAVGASEIATDAVGMTVLLTPLDAGSKGLAVTGKSATGFEVQELRQGSGTYDFDWEVKSVRKGQENYRVLRNKSEIVSAEATGKAEDGQRQQQSTQH